MEHNVIKIKRQDTDRKVIKMLMVLIVLNWTNEYFVSFDGTIAVCASILYFCFRCSHCLLIVMITTWWCSKYLFQFCIFFLFFSFSVLSICRVFSCLCVGLTRKYRKRFDQKTLDQRENKNGCNRSSDSNKRMKIMRKNSFTHIPISE